MKILFVHQNFPGQYLHLARHLAAMPGNEVLFITQRTRASLPGVTTLVYKPQRPITKHLHHYLRGTEAGVLNAQAVARKALELKQAGFVPDVMVGHNGLGNPVSEGCARKHRCWATSSSSTVYPVQTSVSTRRSRISIPRRAFAPKISATCWGWM